MNNQPPMKFFRFLILALVLLVVVIFVKRGHFSEDATEQVSRNSGREKVISQNPVSVDDFSTAWSASSGASDERKELIERAIVRRKSFLKLMAENPSEALDQSISMADYVSLPEELKPYFEKPFNAVGSVDLLWATTDGEAEGMGCLHRNTLTIDGKKLRAYPAGQHMLPVMYDMPVSGIQLFGSAVISTSPVQNVADSDFDAAKTLFKTAGIKNDPLTTLPADGKYPALIAGKIYQFESEISRDYVNKTLLASIKKAQKDQVAKVDIPFEWLAGDVSGSWDQGEGVAPTPYQEDKINVLFIRVDFSDFPGAPISKANLESSLSKVSDHLDAYSYGKASLNYTVSNKVYRMPSTGVNYATDSNQGDGVDGDDRIQTDARALAGSDYTLANYDVVAVYFPKLSNIQGSLITYGGLASVGGSKHWINGDNGIGEVHVILHEFGHNYGLYHANYYHPKQLLGGTYNTPGSLEYGDIFDEMGTGNAPQAHFNPLAKNYLKWLPDSKVEESTGDATYKIYRFDDANALSNPLLAVKVPMSGDVNYWIGYRQLYTGSGSNLNNSAYVVAEKLSRERVTTLIDMTPDSKTSEYDDRRDAGLPVGKAYYNSDAGVRFNTLERGGSTPNEWIKVKVTFDSRISVAKVETSVDEQCGIASVVVRRRFGSSGSVSVDYATGNGNATPGTDYYATSGTLTWADGDLSDKTIVIPIRPDVVSEGVETFDVTLSNLTKGILDPALKKTTISILDAGQRLNNFDAPFFNNTVQAIAPLDDGRIMIGGNISGISGFPSIKNIARLNADGSVDPTFVSGSGFNERVTEIVVQSDGKYLIGGNFTSYNGTTCNHIIRLNSDGTVDTSFLKNIGAAADADIKSIAIETDGDILVGGSFGSFKGSSANGLVRLNASGTPVALNTPLPNGTDVYDLLAEPDGKIVVVGNFNLGWSGSGYRIGIARLNNNGTRDSTFDPDAGAHQDGNIRGPKMVYAVDRQTDGKYIIVGSFTAYDENPSKYCARINNDGSFDPSFTAPAFDNLIADVAAQANGKVVVGGVFTSPTTRIAGLTSAGALDSSFVTGTGFGGPVFKLALGKNGSIWVGGNFFSFNGAACRPIIRLTGGDSPYDVWAKSRFTLAQLSNGDSALDADPDNDGMTNLVEMAMGTNPTLANTDLIFGASKTTGISILSKGGKDYLQISLDKKALEKGAWFLAQFSSDLKVWSPANPTPALNATYDVIENSSTRFTVRDKTPITTVNPRFGRILIKKAE